MTFSQKSGEKRADRRIFQEFASKLGNSARIAIRNFWAANFNYWCCEKINLEFLKNYAAICFEAICQHTTQVIEKFKIFWSKKSKWKQNSNLENQVALPKVLCQNCPKMIHTNINKTNRLSLLMAETIWV